MDKNDFSVIANYVDLEGRVRRDTAEETQREGGEGVGGEGGGGNDGGESGGGEGGGGGGLGGVDGGVEGGVEGGVIRMNWKKSSSLWFMASCFRSEAFCFLSRTANSSEHPQVGDGADAFGPVTAAAPTLFSTQEAMIILRSTVLTLGAWHGERRDLTKWHGAGRGTSTQR